VVCQHGPDECKNNILEGCAIALYPETHTWLYVHGWAWGGCGGRRALRVSATAKFALGPTPRLPSSHAEWMGACPRRPPPSSSTTTTTLVEVVFAGPQCVYACVCACSRLRWSQALHDLHGGKLPEPGQGCGVVCHQGLTACPCHWEAVSPPPPTALPLPPPTHPPTPPHPARAHPLTLWSMWPASPSSHPRPTPPLARPLLPPPPPQTYTHLHPLTRSHANQAGMTWSTVNTCATGPQGKTIQAENEKLTNDLKPAHQV
jgi:hypothetical protein